MSFCCILTPQPRHLTPRTIRLYLSALRFQQISRGGSDPSMSQCPQLHYVLWGLNRQQTLCSRPSRLLITPAIIHILYKDWLATPNDHDKIMLWAACCLGFFAFLRSGEFTSSAQRECTLYDAPLVSCMRSILLYHAHT